MNNPNFMEFLNLMGGANPIFTNNMPINMPPNPFLNPDYNANMNLVNMMIKMMGINGANPNNLLNIFFQPKPQPPIPMPQFNNVSRINLIFMNRNQNIRITIHAKYNESIASVVNKYINKSGDANINLYIVNGRRLDESSTVAKSGLINNSYVDVISVDDVEGANQ